MISNDQTVEIYMLCLPSLSFLFQSTTQPFNEALIMTISSFWLVEQSQCVKNEIEDLILLYRVTRRNVTLPCKLFFEI